MKLEKITIEGTEYYQFIYTRHDAPNIVGDIFALDADIEYQRAKFKEELAKYDNIIL
jgi:hypothetical protein